MAVEKNRVKTRCVHICIRVGIYGAINGQAICEQKKACNDFLGLTCQKWEAVANDFKEGIRTVKFDRF
jgi:NAD dependent epimerase/dehydratase family enzyme